ncbi:MAG TPA: preprotein translocase subunit SecY [Bacilli bacterium]|nr:preprotein translocase subunit SecY [Bacilli bacterium]
MFNNLKQIFSANNKDLRKRIYFTLLVLTIFCIGTNITVPGASSITKELGFLELLNLMAGGSLKNFSIFALGVTPYITASIITQILTMDAIAIPYFKDLKEQGYTGRQKINRITRYMGIFFAFVQGYAFSIAFLGTTSTLLILKTTIILTAGTAFLLWLGDQVTTKGIGNGLSLLIMAGIILTMPNQFVTAFNGLVTNGTGSLFLGILSFALFIMVYLVIVIGIIFIQEAERRVPIQYSNRTNSAYGARQTFLPIKINSANVIPVIFASTLISIPTTIAQLSGKESFSNFVSNYINYTTPTGFALYIILIFFFGYFWTFMSLNPDEMSKNLNKNGGYIPGVRPGSETSSYISKVLSRLTIVGTTFLAFIAALPILFSKFSDLGSSVTMGGTGLLIVVGVAIETYKQLESSLVSRSYKRRPKRI